MITEAEIQAELIDRELCRRKLYPFVARMQNIGEPFIDGWHIDLMCDNAEVMERAVVNVDRGNIALRNIVQMPPRHAKSHTFSKCLPLWFVSRNPAKECIVSGYGQEFISEFGDWVKNTIDQDAYKNVFPEVEWRNDSKAKNRMLTKQGGGIRFVGAGSGITGRGAHLFVVDDPIKNVKLADSEVSSEDLWAWYWTVARTRLAPGAAMVVMHTRWRENDLIGRLLEQEESAWEVLNFPAIAEEDEFHPKTGKLLRREGEVLHPGRYTLEDMMDLKGYDDRTGMDPRDWLALYQQRPVAEEGNLFKREHIHLYKPSEMPNIKLMNVYIATDFAVSTKTTADYTVLWPYGVDHEGCIWWLPDIFRAKVDAGTSIEAMLGLVKRYGALGVQIEKGVIWNAMRPAIEMAMRKAGLYFNINTPTPTHDKVTRASAATAMMQMKQMRFPDTRTFQTDIMPEMLAFPLGKNDDAVDNISIAAGAMVEKTLVLPTGIDFDSGKIDQNHYDDEEEDTYDFIDTPEHGWKDGANNSTANNSPFADSSIW